MTILDILVIIILGVYSGLNFAKQKHPYILLIFFIGIGATLHYQTNDYDIEDLVLEILTNCIMVTFLLCNIYIFRFVEKSNFQKGKFFKTKMYIPYILFFYSIAISTSTINFCSILTSTLVINYLNYYFFLNKDFHTLRTYFIAIGCLCTLTILYLLPIISLHLPS